MVYKIYFKVNDAQDSLIIEGDSIEEIRELVNEQIIKIRKGKPLWSERVGD